MNLIRNNISRVIDFIKRHKDFLITSHTNPEGDALGSQLAFYKLLRAMGRRGAIINEDNVPYEYDFLPMRNCIKKFSKNLKNIRFDCSVVLDCSDLARCGEVSKLILNNKPILNIDHHISNIGFADVNWVEPYASSTCEMIYKLFKIMRINLDKKSALSLYAGVLTDTGSFRYSNTHSFTHKIASELLKYNLNVPYIYKNIYENIPFSDMQLLAEILPTVKKEASGKIIWFQVKQNLLRRRKISFDLTEHILSFARAIKGVEVAVLFKENLGKKNEIRVNFRSQGETDVNRIAQFFGGGGHKAASGATVQGKIEDVRKNVLRKIRENLRITHYT